MAVPRWRKLVDHIQSVPEGVHETNLPGIGYHNRTQFGKQFGEDGQSRCVMFNWDMYADVSPEHLVPKTNVEGMLPMSKTVLLSQVKPGAHNDSVLVVQKALAAAVGLDFSSGPGVFGRLTQDAYARWQRHLGFSGAQADGIPGEVSLKKLGDRFGFKVGPDGHQPPGGRVVSPVPKHHVTYPFGVKNPRYKAGYHTGDDYAAPDETPVVAVRNGTVRWSNDNGGAYGRWIGLQADNGRVYVYCHLSHRGADVGQSVKAGQRIGKVGRTGDVTGPHLHFEDHPAGPFVYAQCRKPSW